jgi:hypothetical protein
MLHDSLEHIDLSLRIWHDPIRSANERIVLRSIDICIKSKILQERNDFMTEFRGPWTAIKPLYNSSIHRFLRHRHFGAGDSI